MKHTWPAHQFDDGTRAGAKFRSSAFSRRVDGEAVRCAFKTAGLTGNLCPDTGLVQKFSSKVEERFKPAWRRRRNSLDRGVLVGRGQLRGAPGPGGTQAGRRLR